MDLPYYNLNMIVRAKTSSYRAGLLGSPVRVVEGLDIRSFAF